MFYSTHISINIFELRFLIPLLALFEIICIGNQMISSAIWNKKAQVNFSKTTKNVHKPIGWVQFVVFEKFLSAYLFQIAWEKSFDYL